MKKRYPQFNRDEHPEETQEEPENSILRIHNQGMALDVFSDYRHRGEMLKEVCLYDYKTFVYCKDVPEGHEESYAPFGGAIKVDKDMGSSYTKVVATVES